MSNALGVGSARRCLTFETGPLADPRLLGILEFGFTGFTLLAIFLFSFCVHSRWFRHKTQFTWLSVLIDVRLRPGLLWKSTANCHYVSFARISQKSWWKPNRLHSFDFRPSRWILIANSLWRHGWCLCLTSDLLRRLFKAFFRISLESVLLP